MAKRSPSAERTAEESRVRRGKSGKSLTTDPFFMVLVLAQQRTIERLRAQVRETKTLSGSESSLFHNQIKEFGLLM